MFIKDKVPNFMFPSTNKLNDMQTVSSVVVRFHNNVYMNFEHIIHVNDSNPIFKVYLNYNHDSNIDPMFIKNKMQDIENSLNKYGVHPVSFRV